MHVLRYQKEHSRSKSLLSPADVEVVVVEGAKFASVKLRPRVSYFALFEGNILYTRRWRDNSGQVSQITVFHFRFFVNKLLNLELKHR